MQHDETTRRVKLRGLLASLRQGKNVQNRDMQTWLGVDGYARYEAEWAAQKDLRDDLANKPPEISRYEALLKRANFTYHKADKFSQLGRHATAKKLFGDADAEFERLLEYLDEIIAADPSLRMWFDRDIDRENLGLTPGAVPMVVTSKSLLNDGKGAGILRAKQSKHQVKLAAVERALSEIEQGEKGTDMRALLAQRKARAVNVHPERDSD